MTQRLFAVVVAISLFTLSCTRTNNAPSTEAEKLVAAAVTRASSEGKSVLIEFGASWCVWCRSFEAFVKAPDAGPIVSKHFVVLNLIVREEARDEAKKDLNTPGAELLMKTWGGEKSGLPFYVFLDGNGKMIANSNAMPGGTNIGFPAVPEEVAAFLTVIDKTAPKLARAERNTLQAYLERVMTR